MTRTASSRRRKQAGFTLVELMVALGLSMILAIVLLKMQAALGQQRMRTSDIAERDAELRASMDIITQDMTGTAFLFGNMTQACEAIFTYNSTGSRFFARHQVDALAAASGNVMNFATGLTLNYPTGSMPSDVLLITSSNDASQFNDGVASQNHGDANAAIAPLTTGTMQLRIDPTPPVVGHQALVEAAIQNASGKLQNACFRVPVSTNPSTNVYGSSSGTYMPGTFYAGFQSTLTAAGFGTLGNGQLQASPAYVDIGDPNPAQPQSQTTTAYYVDNSGAFPVLMRSTWSLLNDQAVGVPQQVAAGVVSIQARFNTGPTNGYQTAANVTALGIWDQVCSVRVAIVTRSLDDDPDPNYVWTPTALTPGTATSVRPGAPFSDVPVATAFQHRRFLLQTTELAVRNSLWSKGVTPTC